MPFKFNPCLPCCGPSCGCDPRPPDTLCLRLIGPFSLLHDAIILTYQSITDTWTGVTHSVQKIDENSASNVSMSCIGNTTTFSYKLTFEAGSYYHSAYPTGVLLSTALVCDPFYVRGHPGGLTFEVSEGLCIGTACGDQPVPLVWQTIIPDIEHDGCTDCLWFAHGIFLGLFDECEWRTFNYNWCSGITQDRLYKDGSLMRLDLAGGNGQYSLAYSSWDFSGPNVMNLDFGASSPCSNWPALLTVEPA